ncbi:endonuclease Q family protein [Candidatus Pacearchaeota archaeon]|nr:endonuclease Q family protein [Candidatus Pacearchaeota archaeon]
MFDKINFNEILFADLHIHSKYSRACSTNLSFENLVKWAKIKGLNLLGTGDFTHPLWIKEIKEKLTERNGFYYYEDFPFLITGEVSLIYTQDSGRRIHLVVLVPNLEIADKINSYLDTKGRRDYDGRPIFKIPGDEFVKEMMKISTDIEIIPAHIWTPWFGVFGSMSGFDSLKECFKEQFDNIHAIETGMSSDPAMNWRIEELDNKSIVSFSDAHSFWPFRLGREATLFKKTDSYSGIIKQIREKSFVGTIETEPAYGKYHWDGHRNCNFSCSPEETKKLNGICPICKKTLTIGVENRVEKLANRDSNFKPQDAKFYYKILPLHELISLNLGSAMESKGVWSIYNSLLDFFGNEFNILLNISKEEFQSKDIDDKLIELILKNREGKIKVIPGYDGEYGKAMIGEKQGKLF